MEDKLIEKKDTRKQNRLSREATEKKSEPLPSKILPVNGSLEVRRVKCGRANCKCAKGELHGPYTYVRTYDGGQRWRKYVKNGDVSTLNQSRLKHKRERKERLEAHRTLKSLLREMRGYFTKGLFDL